MKEQLCREVDGHFLEPIELPATLVPGTYWLAYPVPLFKTMTVDEVAAMERIVTT